MLAALSKTARRRLWWSRQPHVRESAIGRTLSARFHECRFPIGDCSYNSLIAASDGSIYFAIGSHRRDVAARLMRFDPARDTVERIDDLAEHTDPPAIAHGKVHVPFTEVNGRIYMATHVGFYQREGGVERPASWPGMRAYPGGRLLAYDLAGRRFHDIARAPEGEGVLALQVDRDRRRLHALTWPGGILIGVDADTGALDNYGPVFGRGECGEPSRGDWEPIGRDLALDPRDGRVYWSRHRGEIGVLDPDGSCRTLPLRLRVGGQPAAWRRIAWHPREQVFVGVSVPGSRLFRFDPRALGIKEGGALAPQRRRAPFARPPVPTLAFDLDVERDEVRCLVLGPGLSGENGRRTRHTLELVTADLTSGVVSHHGALRLDDGRYPTFAQSLVSHAGRLYAPAWIELPAGDPTPRLRELRDLHGEWADAQIHGEPEEIGLISFADPRGV